MKQTNKILFSLALAASSLLVPEKAEARVGTWDIGYGTKAKGMGGVAVALPQDSLVGAINPAGMVWVGNRGDGQVQFLVPPRTYSWSGSVLTPNQGKMRARPHLKIIPSTGFNKMIDSCSSWGVSLYSAGGQSVYNETNPLARSNVASLSGRKSGVELRQILAAFTYSRWITPCHSIGASLVWVTQTLKVYGLSAFDTAARSVAPGSVTDRNTDWSQGAGFRLGYLGQVCDNVQVGASYTTKMATSRFKKYKGIVTDRGRLDIPAIWAIGVNWNYCPCANASFEWQRVFYKDCPVWSQSIARWTAAGGPNLAGSRNGPGFGWHNLDVYKFGTDYQLDNCWTVRAGYTLSQVPYKATEIDVNIYTQNMGRHHATLGATYAPNDCEEWDISYFHMFRTRVSGRSQLLNGLLGNLSQRMYQDSIEIGYGRKF